MEKEKNFFPPHICGIFEERGVSMQNIKYGFRADMGHCMEFCDTWVAATDEEVAVLETLGGIFEKEKRSIFSRRKSDAGFSVRFWKVFSLDEWENFGVEEFISGGRITALRKDGSENAVVANFTNSEKDGAWNLCRFLAGERISEPKGKEGPPHEESTPHHHPGGPGGPGGRRSLKDLDTKGLLKKMLPFFSKYKKESLAVLLMVVLSTVLGIFTPFVSGSFFYDRVLDKSGDFYGKIFFAIMLIALTKLISVVFSMFHSIVTAKVSARVTYDLKKTIFSAIQRLSLSYFSMRQSGGIMTQINGDATSIYWFFVDGLPYFITNIIQIVAVTVLLFVMNAKLTLIVMLPIPVFLLSRSLFMKTMRKNHARDYSHRRRFNSYVSDIFLGNRVVKAFSREKLEAEKFKKKSDSLAESRYRTVITSNRIGNIIPSVLEIGTWAVWAVGGIAVAKGIMNGKSDFTYGTLVTYISLMSMMYTPLDFFNRFNQQLSECLNAMYRLFQILETPSEVPEPQNPSLPQKTLGEVEFKNVSFEYQPGHRVIDNVSFKVSRGETIGIVGHTGAGKSTLVNLAMRLYDANDGEILIDGVNVKDLPSSYIRQNVAIVSQETYVFCGTIADNIRYAVPEASNEQVISAAKAAGAHDFIIKYPDGYNTKIGTGYRSLSGGELQRISIARAILKDPKILILDEATAAMDTATELRIQRAITEITRDKTTIIIAHRLSTLRDADRLIVIENGKMTESGTHKELVGKKGDYYKLYKMQLDALKIIGVEE